MTSTSATHPNHSPSSEFDKLKTYTFNTTDTILKNSRKTYEKLQIASNGADGEIDGKESLRLHEKFSHKIQSHHAMRRW